MIVEDDDDDDDGRLGFEDGPLPNVANALVEPPV